MFQTSLGPGRPRKHREPPPAPAAYPKMSRQLALSKKCSTREAVTWVAEMMEVRDLMPEDAPSGAAWGMYVWVNQSLDNAATFWASVFPRMLPSRAQLEEQDRGLKDDGSSTIDLISRLQSKLASATSREHGGNLPDSIRPGDVRSGAVSVLSPRAEGFGGEPGVSEEDSPVNGW